ncbi:MAG: hypothetical protein SF066_12065 [Thermoanaerobaculia bacterium]|nr:hypothetical protein [Thermoanaerobaculia bacterium]
MKLTKLQEGLDLPVEWPDLYYRQLTTGPERLVVAPRRDPIDLLGELAGEFGPEYYLLYVLVAERGQATAGRYQSPWVELAEVRAFLSDYSELLANDARQELWIGSKESGDQLVLDHHGLIFAYGPLDDYVRVLEARGLTAGDFGIPFPHTHHYNAKYDLLVDQLISRWDWHRTDLQPGDGE